MNSVQIDRTLTIKYSVAMTDGVAAEIDPLALESQVCFALAVTNRAVLAVYRPLLEPLGLTHPQYLVMLALWDNAKGAGEPLSVKDIARLLQMDSATLSPMLKRLQAQGRITRVELAPRPQSAAAGAGGSTVGRRAPRRRALRTRASARRAHQYQHRRPGRRRAGFGVRPMMPDARPTKPFAGQSFT
jgi:MarR family transcriptional regulator, organic hydroperoxide resistance regulator